MTNWPLVGATLLPNVGGWISALTMRGQVKDPKGKSWYETLQKPGWNPPNWVFAPTWTALYSGMGFASYMVYKELDGFSEDAIIPLSLYGGQLLLNWTWTPIFFRSHNIGLALVNIVALDAVAAACAYKFYEITPHAAYLMLPYLAWIGFATCLNYSIWKRNRATIKEIKD